jgi:hypothetical protein
VGNGDIIINVAKKGSGLYIGLVVVAYERGSGFWRVFAVEIWCANR